MTAESGAQWPITVKRPSFHPRRTFHGSRGGQEFFEVLGSASGRSVLRRWHNSTGTSEIPLSAEHDARLVPAGHRRAHANFALVKLGQLQALWCPDFVDSMKLVQVASPIRNVFKIVSCEGQAALTLSRERSGGRIDVVCTESAQVLQTVYIQDHLLDATVSSCGRRLLWVVLHEGSGEFHVLVQTLGGTDREHVAAYPNSARAPSFSNSQGAGGLIVVEVGGETLLVDPLCSNTLYSWPSYHASIEHVALDQATQRPWIWCETASTGQRWHLSDTDATWLNQVLSSETMHLRLAAVLNSQTILLEDVGFDGYGDLHLYHRGGHELKRVSPVSKTQGKSGLRVRTPTDQGRGLAMWRFEPIAVNPSCCLVLFHGGPAAKDDDAFDPWVVALASLGILVVKANYPGSCGCGDELHQSNTPFSVPSFLSWASELFNAVRKTQSEGGGLRLFVGGWSFGGYLALLTAAASPDRVEGAFAISAPFDLGDVTDELAPRWRFTRKSLERILGSTTEPDFQIRLPRIDESTLLACRRALIVLGTQDDRIGMNNRFRELVSCAERQQHITVLEFEHMGHFLSRGEDIDLTLEHIAQLISPYRT